MTIIRSCKSCTGLPSVAIAETVTLSVVSVSHKSLIKVCPWTIVIKREFAKYSAHFPSEHTRRVIFFNRWFQANLWPLWFLSWTHKRICSTFRKAIFFFKKAIRTTKSYSTFFSIRQTNSLGCLQNKPKLESTTSSLYTGFQPSTVSQFDYE